MNKLHNYLESLTPHSNEMMRSLEQYASEHHVPIMEKESIHFLMQLIYLYQPKAILELGTAIGYSALRMNEAAPMATITTIERNAEMVEIATENIKQANKENQIHVMHAEAKEALENLSTQNKKFDFIFIDAAKAQYKKFFTLAEPLLHEKGIIVCDNVLFKGIVANPDKTENKRLKNLAGKIDSFNQWLMQNQAYYSSIVPIGDGITISIRK